MTTPADGYPPGRPDSVLLRILDRAKLTLGLRRRRQAAGVPVPPLDEEPDADTIHLVLEAEAEHKRRDVGSLRAGVDPASVRPPVQPEPVEEPILPEPGAIADPGGAEVVDNTESQKPRRPGKRRRRRRRRGEAVVPEEPDEAARWRQLSEAMGLGRRVDARRDPTPEANPWVLRRQDGSSYVPDRRDDRVHGPNDLGPGAA